MCVLSLCEKHLLSHPLGIRWSFERFPFFHRASEKKKNLSPKHFFRVFRRAFSSSFCLFKRSNAASSSLHSWLPCFNLLGSRFLAPLLLWLFQPEPRGRASRQRQSPLIVSLNYEDERVNRGFFQLSLGWASSARRLGGGHRTPPQPAGLFPGWATYCNCYSAITLGHGEDVWIQTRRDNGTIRSAAISS